MYMFNFVGPQQQSDFVQQLTAYVPTCLDCWLIFAGMSALPCPSRFPIGLIATGTLPQWISGPGLGILAVFG
jgi:hypothetical protein